jgi:hypothetical protein
MKKTKKTEEIKDVHTEHCCILHGCKYGDDELCTVMKRLAPQSYVCESCHYYGIETLEMVRKIDNTPKKVKRCPHCNHIL